MSHLALSTLLLHSNRIDVLLGRLLLLGHELKGLQAYFNCQIEGLSLPFMALVDYRGFRLIAISLLPISRKTIVYGSDDGKIDSYTRSISLPPRSLTCIHCIGLFKAETRFMTKMTTCE